MKHLINGIQQVGIGVSDADAAFIWYRKFFGTDIVIFKDAAKASLMKQYTGDEIHNRYAILALNMQGGGGIEIWQYTSREPQSTSTPIQLGDLGIFAVKIKSNNINATYEFYKKNDVTILTTPSNNPAGVAHFYIKDPYNNVFEIVEDDNCFMNTKSLTGAVCGVVIGVNDIETSINFYKNILGYDQIIYSKAAVFNEWGQLEGGANHFNRVLLGQSKKQSGAFGNLLGSSHIELVQVTDRKPKKIFDNRYWGDLGFIHVCFDINGMTLHDEICSKNGYPLTVNSCSSFEMENASGHFAYNEDPNGTLIEYVETHKVPILKKLGLYLNLRKRNPEKTLPNWIVRCLQFQRVK